MAEHQDFGRWGESLAAEWLVAGGFTILHQNWRMGKLEIDLIALKGKHLHIVEVKTRHGNEYGWPEESVSVKKFRHLQTAAGVFLRYNPQYKWLRYDLLAITRKRCGGVDYFFREDIFFSR
ncbi:MAG: YraN family protein [Bacteroidota bacterium]